MIAKKWYGGKKDLKNFVYMLVNKRIGTGVVINNEFYQGAYDFVSEIGNIVENSGILRILGGGKYFDKKSQISRIEY